MISCAKSTGKYKINLSQIIFQRKNIFRTPLTVSRGIERPLLKPAVLGKPFTIRRWLLRQIFFGSKTQKKLLKYGLKLLSFPQWQMAFAFYGIDTRWQTSPRGWCSLGTDQLFLEKITKIVICLKCMIVFPRLRGRQDTPSVPANVYMYGKLRLEADLTGFTPHNSRFGWYRGDRRVTKQLL